MVRTFFSELRPCMLGLAFVHMWIYCSTHRFLESGGVSVTVALYSAMSVTLVVLGAALRYRRRHGMPEIAAPSGRHGLAADLAAATVMALGGVALSVELPAGLAAVATAGAAAGGVGVTWAYGRWVQVYAKLDLRFSAPLIFLTMVVGSSCKTVIDFLPGLSAAVVFALLPFATFACARRSLAQAPASPEPDRYYNPRTIGSLKSVVRGVAMFSVTMGVVQAALLETMPEPYVPSVLVNHGTEVLIALVFFWWVGVSHRGLDFSRTWRLILILVITALVFESFLVGTPAHAMLLALMRTAHALLVVYFLFLAVSDVARHSSYEPLVVYAAGWLAYTLPFTAGNLVGAAAIASPLAPYVTSAAAWVLMVAVLALLDDRSLGNQLIFAELNGDGEDDTPAKRAGETQRALDRQQATASDRLADAVRTRCQELARAHGLTAREREVLELLVRGHSKTRIAETFLISENTVRGHTKHIYAKLDVHSKQELLDLFETR